MTQQIAPVTRNLLILHIFAFVVQAFALENRIDMREIFGLHYFESKNFQIWQILTYIFMHGDFHHFLSNMLGLFFLGSFIEYTLSSRRFLAFYMVCGMGAGLFHYGVLFGEMQLQKAGIEKFSKNPTEENFLAYLNAFEKQLSMVKADDIQEYVRKENYNPTEAKKLVEMRLQSRMDAHNIVGASGAIFGILGAMFLLFPNLQMMLLFFPTPIKAKYLLGAYLVYELWAGMGFGFSDNIAHFAHLGGALMAFILIKFWGFKRQY